MSKENNYNLSEDASKKTQQVGKFAARKGGKLAKKAMMKTKVGGALIKLGVSFKPIAIAFLCFLIVSPLLIVVNSPNTSFDPITNLDVDVDKEEDVGTYDAEAEMAVGQEDVIAQDVIYTKIIVKYMAEDYNQLSEIIKAKCEAEGVDVEESMKNIADNTALPYVSGAGGGNSQAVIKGAIDWAVSIANDDSWTYPPQHQAGCYICGTCKKKQYTCMPFVTAAYAHGGGDPEVLKICKKCHSLSTTDSNFTNCKCFQMVGRCTDLTYEQLQPGDVLVQYSSDNDHGHMAMFIGDGKLVHAQGGSGKNSIAVTNNAKKFFNSLKNKSSRMSPSEGHKNYVMRYVGNGSGATSANATNAVNGALDWAKKIAADDSFCYGLPKDKGGYANANGCYFCGTNASKVKKSGGDERYNKTYMCQAFVLASYAHGAGDPDMLKLCQNRKKLECTDKVWKKNKCWEFVGRAKDVKLSQLKPGDVLVTWDKHMAMYLGSGNTIDARSTDCWGPNSIAIRKGAAKKFLKHKNKSFVMRYKGSQDSSASTSAAPSTVAFASGRRSQNRDDVINGACAWAVAIAADDSFHYGACNTNHGGHNYGVKPKVNANHKMCSHHNGCYFCKTNRNASLKWVVDKDKTYCCNPFVHAAYAHGGGEPTMLKICKSGTSYGFSKGEGYDTSKLFKKLGHPSVSQLQKGDVLCTGSHAMLYLGGGKKAEAGGRDDNVRGSKSWKNSIRVSKTKGSDYDRAYRYIGNGGGVMEVPAGGTLSEGTPKISAEELPTYTDVKVLEEITRDDGKIKKLVGNSTYTVTQSMALTNENYFAVAWDHNPSMARTRVSLYDSEGKHKKDKVVNGYHSNSCTVSETGQIWIGGSLVGNSSTVRVVDVDNTKMSDAGTKTLPSSTSSGLAYDKETQKYILASGPTILVYDSKLSKVERTIQKKHGHAFQDVGASEGVIYVCHAVKKGSRKEGSGNNFIDMFRESDGAYVGSYHLNYGETESCVVVDGELVILNNIIGDGIGEIQWTGKRLLGGEASQAIDYEAAAATRDVASVINAFSVYEAQKLPVLELDDEKKPSILKLLIHSVKTAIARDKDPEATLEKMLEKHGKARRVDKGGLKEPAFYNIIYAKPIKKNGKKYYPLIEVNPANGRQLARLFGMDPDEDYHTEFITSKDDEEEESSRGKGDSYEVGDTNVATAIETNTDSHLELLYDSLTGIRPVENGTLVLPIKNMFTSIPLTKTFAEDQKGIECVTKKSEVVYASERGFVKKVVENDPVYGNYVEIEGQYDIIYAGLTSISNIVRGEMADQNKALGECKGTFRMEVSENGTKIDPEPLFIKKNGLSSLSTGESEEGGGDGGDIVAVALKEVGTKGGAKYRKWYTGRADGAAWCATFVSWCANECGYIEQGIIPKFANCGEGGKWFRKKKLWKKRGYKPNPGDIIFFDNNHSGGEDHVGIVESCDGKTVHTIEGNSGNAVRQRSYSINDSRIFGYGTPQYPASSAQEGVVDGRRTKAPNPKTNKYYKPPANNFPRNTAGAGGNCTWYAWGRFMEYHGDTSIPDLNGHAVMFWDSAKGKYKRGQSPKPGAIAVWGYGSKTGRPGHVAFVEEVKSNGNIVITESGWGSTDGIGFLFRERELKAPNYSMGMPGAVFVGFIYPKKEASTASTAEVNVKTDKGKKGKYQKYAASLLSSYGWSKKEFTPLKKLWNRESGWNPKAKNPSSGAYGIPQSLPAKKMASEGSDYLTNYKTQIRWGLKYIKNRYGSPSKAWKHSQDTGWY